jgi:hypothetical protein
MFFEHMNTHTPRFPRSTAARSSWVLLSAICAATAGCDTSKPWDAEFECKGQEQSISTFAGDDPANGVRKGYPIHIDFHLRADTAMVRSSLLQVNTQPDGLIRFDSKGINVWVSGQFDKRSNRLSLVEERTLTIEGREQQVRTTGQYVCDAMGTGKAST